MKYCCAFFSSPMSLQNLEKREEVSDFFFFVLLMPSGPLATTPLETATTPPLPGEGSLELPPLLDASFQISASQVPSVFYKIGFLICHRAPLS